MIYPASPAARSMPSGVGQPLPRKTSPRELRLVLTGELGGLQHMSWVMTALVVTSNVSIVVFLLGAVLLMAATCCLMLLNWSGNAYPWLPAPALGLAAAAGPSGLLVLVKLRAAQAILPPHLFRDWVFITGDAVTGLAAMALFAAVVFLPLMFQLLMGASSSRAGLMIAPMMGGVIVASFAGAGWCRATAAQHGSNAADDHPAILAPGAALTDREQRLDHRAAARRGLGLQPQAGGADLTRRAPGGACAQLKRRRLG